jgi:hypothetical protein
VTSPDQSAGDQAVVRDALVVEVTCVADVAALELSCEPLNRVGTLIGPQFLIVGGQGVFVLLENTPPQLQGPRFKFDVTVKNLIPQTLGTPDGTNVTGVDVFFFTPPYAVTSSGPNTTITIDNAQTGTFTNTGQAYYSYPQAILPGSTSAAVGWQFTLGNDVETFAFQVYVAADVPFPNGFVQVSPDPDLTAVGGFTDLTGTVVDVVGRSVSGRTISWSSSDGSVATVNTSGRVTGLVGGVVDIAATSDGPEAAGTSRVTVIDPSGYDIELRYVVGATETQRTAFENAVSRWESHITGELYAPAVDEIIDDLLILVVLDSIDGPSNILGQAGPCYIRTSNTLPILGLMQFDTADLAGLESSGQLGLVIQHEMAHVIGLGTLWDNMGLLVTDVNCLIDPYFTGAQANIAFDDVGGDTYTDGNTVPVANTGGGGTRCGHWRESVFDNELMTGYLNSGSNPLSIVTIESFEDQGYAVDPTGVDAYTLPGSTAGPSALAEKRPFGDDIWRGPIYSVDEQGRLTLYRPGQR